jgi:hypothetical protein
LQSIVLIFFLIPVYLQAVHIHLASIVANKMYTNHTVGCFCKCFRDNIFEIPWPRSDIPTSRPQPIIFRASSSDLLPYTYSFCGIRWRHRATIKYSISAMAQSKLDAPISSWIFALQHVSYEEEGKWQFFSGDQTTNTSLELMNFYIFYSFTSRPQVSSDFVTIFVALVQTA